MDSAMYSNQREDQSFTRHMIDGFISPVFQRVAVVRFLFMCSHLYMFNFACRLLIPVYGVLVFYIVVLAFAVFMYYEYEHWRWRSVPGPVPSLPWGTEYGVPFWNGTREFHRWLYYENGGKNYCGYIHIRKPTLFVGNPSLIRHIAVRDSAHFTDRNPLMLTDTLRNTVYALGGQDWKDMRALMTPAFSASVLRKLHPVCLQHAANLRSWILEMTAQKGEVELKDAFGRYTMENAASYAFGVNDCNAFADTSSEFVSNAVKLFERPTTLDALRQVLLMLFVDTGVDEWLRKYILWDPYAPAMQFFTHLVRAARERQENGGKQDSDFLQLLIDAKDADDHRALSDASIAAQCVLFFTVGYDTTAALLTFCVFSLAREPEWQRRVHAEIDKVLTRHNGDLTFEATSELLLTGRVLTETLRLYPPAISVERTCTEDYNLPGTDVKILKGMKVQIPVFQLHRDAAYFPEPERFDPDRFLTQAMESQPACAFMPFGVGPRNCLAVRFIMYQAKVALVALLKGHQFVPSASTPAAPMPLDERAPHLTPKRGCGFAKLISRD